jgi:hypothetical protein
MNCLVAGGPKTTEILEFRGSSGARPHSDQRIMGSAEALSQRRFGDSIIGNSDGRGQAQNQAALRFGRRLIYGGHVIALARAISFNGLGNAFHIAAINGGRHVSPMFAGATVFAWSEVLAKSELPGRDDVGALRIRTVAMKDRPCADFPYKTGDEYDPQVLLDLDYWTLIPR